MNYAKRQKLKRQQIRQKAKVDAILNKINSFTKYFKEDDHEWASLIVINGISLGYYTSTEWLSKVSTKKGLEELFDRIVEKRHYFQEPKVVMPLDDYNKLNSLNKDE